MLMVAGAVLSILIGTVRFKGDYHQMHEEMKRLSQEVQAMLETVEILQDTELMEAIREGMKALENGDTISLEEAKRVLGIE